MVDIENAVYTEVRAAAKAVASNIDCSGTYVPVPKHFPHLYFAETENRVYTDSITLNSRENHARVQYQADVYCIGETKKTDAKAIAAAVDEKMLSLGFVREFMGNTPNMDDSIYRVTLRYSGIVSVGEQKGANTVYRVYNS